jgi:chaperone required for assembly of F1-ATPase
MREIFDDIFHSQPFDPMESARRNMRPGLRTRFYQKATVAENNGAYAVRLDERPVRSPAKRWLTAPVRAIAEAIAAEWNAQEKLIDPATMPLTRLANSIIDGVMPSLQPVADEITKYLSTDMVFYRAEQPEGLVALQRRHWDPVLDWAHRSFGARFLLAEGTIYIRQSEAAIEAVRPAIPTGTASAADAWRLGALSVMTTLSGSALLALGFASGHFLAEDIWNAAHVDEDWNLQQWGGDALALEQRTGRRKEFDAAAVVLDALRT